MFDPLRIMQYLRIVPVLVQHLFAGLYEAQAYRTAHRAGDVAVLCGKTENDIHHNQCRKERKRLQYIPQQFFQKQFHIFHIDSPILFLLLSQTLSVSEALNLS